MRKNIYTPKHIVCKQCENEFIRDRSKSTTNRQKYCSKECSLKAHSKKVIAQRRELNLGAKLNLSGGKIGKINEFIVAIDLLKRGYEVYSAFEDTHPFDILALKDDKLLKIEVKTANILPSGLKIYAMKKNQEEKHDILALVDNLQNIEYRPELI